MKTRGPLPPHLGRVIIHSLTHSLTEQTPFQPWPPEPPASFLSRPSLQLSSACGRVTFRTQSLSRAPQAPVPQAPRAFRSGSPALSQVQPHLPGVRPGRGFAFSSAAFSEPRVPAICGVSALAGFPPLSSVGGCQAALSQGLRGAPGDPWGCWDHRSRGQTRAALKSCGPCRLGKNVVTFNERCPLSSEIPRNSAVR